MKILKRFTLLFMLSFWTLSFANDENMFITPEGNDTTNSLSDPGSGGLDPGDDGPTPVPINEHIWILTSIAVGGIVLMRKKLQVKKF